MDRRGSKYTDLGRKISVLASNQSELAEVLDLTQQSISGKLTGKISVTLKDLEILCEKYGVPMIYFFTATTVTPEMSRVWDQVIEAPPEVQHTIAIAAKLPEPFARQLFRIAQAIQATASYYTDSWHRDADAELAKRGFGPGR